MKLKYLWIGALAGLFAMASCKKEDPIVPNEEELITTLRYTLVSADKQDTAVFEFLDLDGDGGNAPSITNDELKANTAYTGTILLLNEQEVPAENITIEVETEGEEHQFFYEVNNADLTVSYGDTDAAGKPLGIKTNVQAGSTGVGELTITLRHEPNKSAAGVEDGDITNAGGETDIEVVFDVEIL